MNDNNQARVLSVVGTRPEAIKLSPLIGALRSSNDFHSTVLSTGQHREMLDQVLEIFGIKPDLDLGILRSGQSLADISERVLHGMSSVLLETRPDLVLVQGDTTSAMAAALASFYAEIPVVHVEAGLRSGDTQNPYPEEMNRRLITQLASFHLAPTDSNRANLLAEGIAADRICVTGNTVIDALHQVVAVGRQDLDAAIADLRFDERRLVLVTAHRRESWGDGMGVIGAAIAELAKEHPAVVFLVPMHRNPIVRESLLPHFQAWSNIRSCEPLDYVSFCWAMQRSYLILTDSGGVQEEGPSLGKPVLVMRRTTERPEAVAFGTARIVGTDHETIVQEVSRLLADSDAYTEMALATNPYGDGRAAPRSLQALKFLLGRADRPQDFVAVSTHHDRSVDGSRWVRRQGGIDKCASCSHPEP